MSPGVLGPTFPDFELDGFSSADARQSSPLAVLFWRTGCSTSRMMIPFWQRLHNRFPSAEILAVSQDEVQTTAEWCNDHDITMRQLIDAPGQRVSRQFGIKTVPAFWLTDHTGGVLVEGESWDRGKLEQINTVLSAKLGQPYEPLVTEDDGVPAFKPG